MDATGSVMGASVREETAGRACERRVQRLPHVLLSGVALLFLVGDCLLCSVLRAVRLVAAAVHLQILLVDLRLLLHDCSEATHAGTDRSGNE
eukprot:2943811-Rhodomonas_salina.1